MLQFQEFHSNVNGKLLTRYAHFNVTHEDIQAARESKGSPIQHAIATDTIGIDTSPKGLAITLDTNIGWVSALLGEHAREWDSRATLGIVQMPMLFRVVLWGALTQLPYYTIEPALSSDFVKKQFNDTNGQWEPIAQLARKFGIEPGKFYFLMQEVECLETEWGKLETRKATPIGKSDYRITING